MAFVRRVVLGLLMFPCLCIAAQTNYYYVVTNNLYAEAPFTNWAMAATDIHAAVDEAQKSVLAGDTHVVLISNGVYNVSQSIIITNSIRIRGVSGAEETVIRADATGFRLVNVLGAATAGMELNGLTFTGANAGGGYGGAVNFESTAGSGWCIANCVFSNNVANRGGALYLNTIGTLDSCRFIVNRAAGTYGGAIRDNVGCAYYNCLFDGNEVAGAGGAMFLMGNALFENCTFTRNKGSGSYVAGGILIWFGAVNFYNTIIYDNFGDGGDLDNINVRSTTVSFSNCCITPLLTTPQPSVGVDCIDDPPLFEDPGSGYGVSRIAGDYRLTRDSPCVNTGLNRDWMVVGISDLDGNPRILSGRVDMGVYEYMPPAGTFFFFR